VPPIARKHLLSRGDAKAGAGLSRRFCIASRFAREQSEDLGFCGVGRRDHHHLVYSLITVITYEALYSAEGR